MENLKTNFENIEWTDEESGIYHGIENEDALIDCVKITKDFTLRFYKWVKSLSVEDVGDDTDEQLLTFFEAEIY